jgi:multidrug efflux pump subunit AcrA (membrane-fusion protein)
MAQGGGLWKKSSSWLVLVCLLAGVALVVWFLRRPTQVAVTHPRLVSLTETIASSARVGGVQESAVGAQFSGTVEQLFVRAGDRVTAGQKIAVLKNAVTQQQKAQAQTAVQTARARVAQVSRAPTQSEMDEAAHQVTEAQAQAAQAKADLQLATRQFERSQQMFEQKVISRSEFDTVQSNQQSLLARVQSAKATAKVREARLETLKNTPRPEDVQVAKAQLAEAEQALRVAEQQAKEAVVTAPFAGVVTTVNAEQGQTVGARGVVDLVSDSLEIRVDLDEGNLADLEVGQKAILSSSALGGNSFEGRLTDIGAAVDQARGIVTVKITPDSPPAWLRPGQTVNVNLITNEKADRLIVPSTAVRRQGGRSIVMIVEDGRTVERAVSTRPAVDQGIPVASGVTKSDEVVVDPTGVTPGQMVRVRRQGV